MTPDDPHDESQIGQRREPPRAVPSWTLGHWIFWGAVSAALWAIVIAIF